MISAPLSPKPLFLHTAKVEMFSSHLEIGGWKAEDNLEFLTRIWISFTDGVVGIIGLFTGQNIERREQRQRSNCPNTLWEKQANQVKECEEGAVKEKLSFVGYWNQENARFMARGDEVERPRKNVKEDGTKLWVFRK